MLNEKRIDRIDDLLSKIQPDLQVMLDNVHSSQNLSAIIHSADAVRVLDIFSFHLSEGETRKTGKYPTRENLINLYI